VGHISVFGIVYINTLKTLKNVKKNLKTLKKIPKNLGFFQPCCQVEVKVRDRIAAVDAIFPPVSRPFPVVT